MLRLLLGAGLVLAASACSRPSASPPGAAPPGEQVLVAAAANFAATLEGLAARFGAADGARVEIASAASGTLYTQIVAGAPFDVLLSADAERPRHLEESGAGVAGTRFTYALGTLVLWSPTPGLVDPEGRVLATGSFRHLAIADPATAPYGAAARAALEKLGLWPALEPRLVRGTSIAQTYQFVASGAAELGFVALAQVVDQPPTTYWRLPRNLYPPLEQQAILLRHGATNPAAHRLLAYLRSEEARAVIRAAGYEVPVNGAAAAAGRD